MDEAATTLSKDEAKQERIAMRAKRIQDKLEAEQEQEEGDDGVASKGKRKEGEKELRRGKAQIIESRQKLEILKTEGIQQVTSIRVQGDERENLRRIQAETRRQERRQKLLYEAESSAKRNAVVAMRWSQLFERDVPLELLKDMEIQKDACDRIIQVKEELIREFQQELKNKDDEYVKALKKQAEDTNTLLYHTEKHYAELRKAYEEELEFIDDSYEQERHELITANKAEWDELILRRESHASVNLEVRLKRINSDQDKLEQLRVQNVEDYNVLKIKLEFETQKLEQTLQEMRATYQLNTEKLEYNYRVLSERNKENQTTIAQQKRKLSRLQDQRSSLMAKYYKTDKAYQAQNFELTDEYRRITEQFKDLQAKFRHFEYADGKRFKEVWEMNEDLLLSKMEKVLMADKILHEQQLGLYWFPPDYDKILSAFRKAKTFHMNRNKKKKLDNEPAKIEASEMGDELLNLLELLVDEAGFLSEGKVSSIIADLPLDTQKRMRMDGVLKALSIETEEAATQMIRFFERPKEDDETKQREDDDGENQPIELVDAEDVIRALRTFVEDQQRQNPVALLEVKKKAPTDKARTEVDCWHQAAHVISDRTVKVWSALERSMQKYNQLLTERSKLIEECETLRQQDHELKMLLNQYLRAQVNVELHVPPTQTIAGLQGSG